MKDQFLRGLTGPALIALLLADDAMRLFTVRQEEGMQLAMPQWWCSTATITPGPRLCQRQLVHCRGAR